MTEPNGQNKAILNPAELNIVIQLGKGKRNKEVAAILGISPETVKSRRKMIYLKNDVENIIELFRKHPYLLKLD